VKQYKSILLWVFLIVIFVFIYQTLKANGVGHRYSFTTFVQQALPAQETCKDPTVTCSAVDQVTIRGKEIEGVLKSGERFVTAGDIRDYQKELIARGVDITYEKEDQNAFWLSIVGTWLPMGLLFFLFFFFMRQLQVGGGRAMSFGKSKARLLNESQNRVTFKDVAGIEESKQELEEIVQFLKDPKKFTRLGGRIPKGVLLMGPPGTGKTLLARAVAGEAGVPFFSISGSDFVEMFVGVGASRVRDLFEQGKKNAPCIIFIDEIDAVGRHRGAGLGGGHDEREQTLNQLLVEMDGFEANEGVILVAATNRPDVLDPALLRPGRFDRRVVVALPDVRGREQILQVHTRKTPLGRDVDLDNIARGTPGFAGADLENLVNEAALLAARRSKDLVENVDFEDAKDKVLMGAERRSLVLTEKERHTTAVHEAGHTLVAKHVTHTDPVHKVTIIPRGRALGLTQQLPAEDRHSYDRAYLMDRLAILMGGRVAEEVVFEEPTSGAGNDIEVATEMARRMVCEFGMSVLGAIAFGRKEEQVFLGRDLSRHQDYSDNTAIRVDREIKRLINDNYDRAQAIVLEHRADLDRLAAALMEYESLDNEEIEWILGGKDIVELKADKARIATSNGPGAPSLAQPRPQENPPASVLPPIAEPVARGRQEGADDLAPLPPRHFPRDREG